MQRSNLDSKYIPISKKVEVSLGLINFISQYLSEKLEVHFFNAINHEIYSSPTLLPSLYNVSNTLFGKQSHPKIRKMQMEAILILKEELNPYDITQGTLALLSREEELTIFWMSEEKLNCISCNKKDISDITNQLLYLDPGYHSIWRYMASDEGIKKVIVNKDLDILAKKIFEKCIFQEALQKNDSHLYKKVI